MDLRFSGVLWYWRGPAPYYFVTVPVEECEAISIVAAVVSYGWGMIPATVRVGDTVVSTSLWPKDGGYIVPLKKQLRTAELLELGDVVNVRVGIRV
ncbi:DUF1905 domain-containing protein [Subtercola boreus]|uniref:DUF1905 domain-containing protein n=1 Tax=Subtercola boreus TaxID=120213 RepID=A0A3E0WCB6_9MICO|nr:DUF1905 domain-containing protein [Subtercola boreus]RFA21015.1 hypothetical protein B7R24_06295 [Subtercola boreus]RFA21399.1 hypothetical protein B7R23_06240 [Subtercola boreus]RFA27370.1 hypothetical protein B7R25_06365 [Subtercola boreus]